MINNNETLRVAVVMGRYTTGGIKSVISNYYKAIDKKKVQFDLIVEKESATQNYDEFTSKGARIFEVSPLKKNPFKNIIEIKKILKDNEYKIVHGYLNTLNIFPMLSGFLARTPVRIAENLSTAHPKEPKSKIKNILKPFSSLFSTRIAANSMYAAEWIYGEKKAKKATIFRNGLDLDEFVFTEELRKKRRRELGINNEFLIGHIGRYEFQKNHNFIIEIFYQINKIIPESKLLLIGYGDLKDDIWDKIKKLNLEDHIIDGGSSTQNVGNYNAMDCFLMPSYYEGLPVVGIEAQATGLPCVFSTEITQEVRLIDAVSFLDLDKTSLEWANCVIEYKDYNRGITKEILKNNGYDINEEAKKLEAYYTNQYI